MRNYERPAWCYLLWGVPALLVVGSFEAQQFSILSTTSAEIIWVTAVAWAGVGCLINGQSCGRVHCRIDGILFPLLSIFGALSLASIISFSWNLFWLSFAAILVGNFVPELVWKKYA